MVPRDKPGLELPDNWDAMGMRASGSSDVIFKNCLIPQDGLFGMRDNYGKAGRGFADFALNANLPLISSFLGIAEAARDLAVQTVTSQKKGPSRKIGAPSVRPILRGGYPSNDVWTTPLAAGPPPAPTNDSSPPKMSLVW
jgi:alkylation response protein AidB-like acyl-CoA dehydrogenase